MQHIRSKLCGKAPTFTQPVLAEQNSFLTPCLLPQAFFPFMPQSNTVYISSCNFFQMEYEFS